MVPIVSNQDPRPVKSGQSQDISAPKSADSGIIAISRKTKKDAGHLLVALGQSPDTSSCLWNFSSPLPTCRSVSQVPYSPREKDQRSLTEEGGERHQEMDETPPPSGPPSWELAPMTRPACLACEGAQQLTPAGGQMIVFGWVLADIFAE